MTSTTRQTHQPVPRGPVARVAIVAGGSHGIGHSIVPCLAADGFAVVISHGGNASAAEAAAQGIRAGGGNAIAVQGDIGRASGDLLAPRDRAAPAEEVSRAA